MSILNLVACLALGGDGLPSGPPKGEELKEFKVLGFSGPQAGKEFEVIKEVSKKPSVIVFVGKITRPALKFLRPIDELVAGEEKLAAHFVWHIDDKDKTEEFLKRAQNSLGLKTPLSIGLDGKAGPPAYGLNDMVAVTVLVAQGNRVVANFALVDPNETDARKVIEAIREVLKKK